MGDAAAVGAATFARPTSISWTPGRNTIIPLRGDAIMVLQFDAHVLIEFHSIQTSNLVLSGRWTISPKPCWFVKPKPSTPLLLRTPISFHSKRRPTQRDRRATTESLPLPSDHRRGGRSCRPTVQLGQIWYRSRNSEYPHRESGFPKWHVKLPNIEITGYRNVTSILKCMPCISFREHGATAYSTRGADVR